MNVYGGIFTKKQILILLFAIVFSILSQVFNETLALYYHNESHAAFHSILESFSILVSFSIFIYGWTTFQSIKTRTLLWLPLIFLTVGAFDILHTLTYPGLPHFITESSIEKTAWFWIVARFTEAVGIVIILLIRDKVLKKSHWNSLGLLISIIFVLVISIIIFVFEKTLPTLIHPITGPTLLKNNLEYFISFLQFFSIMIIVKKIKAEGKNSSLSHLITAFGLLFISEMTLTLYIDLSDVNVLIGHLYKALGYLFILKAYFFSKMKLTIELKTKAEQDLKSTQILLDSFFQHSPDSITIMDIEGKILRVNAGFEQVYGWKEEEVEGKYFYDVMPDVRDSVLEVLSIVSKGESLIGYEAIRKHKNGADININMTISPVRNEDGSIINIAAITRDITKQKQYEQKIIHAQQELKDTVHNQQGIIFKFKKYGDEFIHTLFGGADLTKLRLTSDQVVGVSLNVTLGEKARFFTPLYEKAWSGEEVSYETESNGHQFFVTLKPVIRNGCVIEVIGSGFDISQLKQTEELLHKSEKLAVVGQLAAGVAHEIRNPLTTLKGFTQLLNAKTEPENEPFMELMLSELDRIEMITNEFMVVAKPQAIKFQQNNIRQLLNQVIFFSTPQANLNNVEILIEYKTDIESLQCDGNQIKQVLINLIKNSIEAMETGGKISVVITESCDAFLEITITDNGVGIPPEIIPRLGEPFYTLKEKGTGLGLMVSYRIIEAHKGTIQFHSEESEGTTVILRLPHLES